MTIKHKIVTKSKLSSFLIPILPILSIYKIGPLPLTFGDAAAIYIVIITLVNCRKLRAPKYGFYAFFAAYFAISLTSILLRGQRDVIDFTQKWLRITIYYFIIDFSCRSKGLFDFVYMQKCSIITGLLVSAILFLQVVAAKGFGRSLTFFIPFFPLDYGGLTAEQISNIYNNLVARPGWRPISIFCEPAYFAQFTCLPLGVSLFCNETVMSTKYRWITSTILTTSILLSFSANGIFIVVLLWVMWYFWYMRSEKTTRKYIIGIFAVFVGVYVLVTTNVMSSALMRLGSVRSSGSSTGTLRLLQGIEVFKKLNLFEKFIGIGFGNVEAYLVENRITTAYLSDIGNEYMNGFSTVLVSGGLIGFVLYLILWMRFFFIYRNPVNRAAFIVISVLFCTSSLFYSCTTVMYLVFVQCFGNEEHSVNLYGG